MHPVLQILKLLNLTVNGTKCEFGKQNIDFYGLQLTDHGVQPTPEKLRAVFDSLQPSSTSEVRIFLETVGFGARFLPEPKFVWGKEQLAEFDKFKRQLTSSATLAYFDPEAKTEVTTDASPVGLAAIPIQDQVGDRRPVAYASRTSSPVEQPYSQTEREV